MGGAGGLRTRALKLLVLTNMYPPHHLGGYELLSRDVLEHLRRAGHEVTVLTSWRGRRRPWGRGDERRWLRLRLPQEPMRGGLAMELLGYVWNRVVAGVVVARVQPDAVVVFNSSGLGAPLLGALHRQGRRPVLHDVCDTYLVHMAGADAWLSLRDAPLRGARRAARRVLLAAGRPVLGGAPRVGLCRSHFRSQWLLDQHRAAPHLDVDGAVVIRNGTKLPADPPPPAPPASILFVGRLVPEKGPQILLDALAALPREALAREPRVTIAGPAPDEAFCEELRGRAARLDGVPVEFLGHIPHAAALHAMREHAILAYPVTWDEPSGGSLPEAMAAGMAVVATGTGGSGELLVDGENALVVPPGDADALAGALGRLILDDGLRARVTAGARATAAAMPLDAMLDEVAARIAAAVRSGG